MGTLFGALGSAGEALRAFQRAVDVTQNNVTNANSPGYAKQVPSLDSLPFDPATGLTGGVQEHTQDSRNEFAEIAVQQQTSLLGAYQQLQTSLAPLQGVFDVSANSTIPSALNQLFQSFSAWSTQPANTNYRNAVLTAAGQVATAFQQAAGQLNGIRASTDRNLQSTIDQINQDASKIRDYNAAVARSGGAPDAGLQAQLHTTLEDLSSLADVQAVAGNGNTVTVLLGGQIPLVIGDQQNALQLSFPSDPNAANPNAPANAAVLDSTGVDVTAKISSGSLHALLSVRNNLIPSLAGGPQVNGDLNTLAKGLADTVNNVLAQGSTTAGPPFQPGSPLFSYDGTSAVGVAASLQVNPTITASQLAPVDPGPPVVSNGTALKLAGLDNSSGGQINGLGFTQFFSTLVSRVGSAAKDADTGAAAQAQVVAQAKTLRQQLSGVSLDEEAIRLIELQRTYQAASKVVNVVDQLAQSLLSMIP
ncbi:MAG TPA: flagellar hook-associated protein FlgK [Bryobacteraceae bacterium]|nr:flagellar hook-associated protein FlgK [Bryobacteraceae bacterium]